MLISRKAWPSVRQIGASTMTASIVFIINLVLVCFISRAQSTVSDPVVLRFNAKWWQHADSDEQQGFIYGYTDCIQPVKAPVVSIVVEQTFVSTALDSQKPDAPKTVPAAIKVAWASLKSEKIPPGAEVFGGPHGYLDGEWWGGFRGPWPSELASSDRGYLEGYLECSSVPVTVQAVRRYQVAINQHYASGRHSQDKIADVLQRLLGQPAAAKK